MPTSSGPSRPRNQTACVGKVVTAPVGDAVLRGTGDRKQSGGTGQYNGVGGAVDASPPAYRPQNNVTGDTKL